MSPPAANVNPSGTAFTAVELAARAVAQETAVSNGIPILLAQERALRILNLIT
jgi:hypothetical protein